MNKTITGIVLVLIVLGGAYYLSTKDSSTPAPASNTPAATVGAAVSIQNFSFSPATLSVKIGETVTWTNNDAVAHTVTSDSGTLLDSQSIAPGASFSVTFTSPGTVAYHCAIHTMMKGTVTVGN